MIESNSEVINSELDSLSDSEREETTELVFTKLVKMLVETSHQTGEEGLMFTQTTLQLF